MDEARRQETASPRRRKDGQPFAFAGLWEEWERGGEVTESCTIITTQANDLMLEFHDRMPVILNPRDYDLWLDPEVQDPKVLEPLLRPYPSDQTEVYAVSRRVMTRAMKTRNAWNQRAFEAALPLLRWNGEAVTYESAWAGVCELGSCSPLRERTSSALASLRCCGLARG
jgi:hypothetical protein